MSVSRYRLNAIGWIGAIMFVLPVPLTVWEYNAVLKRFAESSAYNRALEQVRGTPVLPEFPTLYFTALATASLVGLILLLVGRDIVTRD